MPSEAFIIREITGSERSVSLRSRALPYRPILFPATQAYVQRWYPGNAIATLQVLGPREGDVEIQGMWKDRFLLDPRSEVGGGAVVLEGFDDIPNDDLTVSAEDLVIVFQRLRAAGNTLEVRWGPEVRRGIMSRFDPYYLRTEDIRWTANFTWSQRGDRPALRAAIQADTVEAMRASIDSFDAALAAEPPGLLPNIVNGIRGFANDFRAAAFAFTNALAEIQTTATVATAAFQNILTLSGRVVQFGRALKNGTLDLPYVDLLPLDAVESIFAADTWKQNVGSSARTVQSTAVQASNDVARTAVPDAIATVVVRENESLRLIAFQFYNDSDAWPIIADANGIVGSDVPAGTVIAIPRAPQAGSAATAGQGAA